MLETITTRAADYTVECRSCRETFHVPLCRMPDSAIVAACTECGHRAWYRADDIFLGRPLFFLSRKPARLMAV